jgi:transketolase
MAAATETDKMAALATAANEARGLAMDSIAAAHSGHMGLPLGCAEIGSVLYGSQVRTIMCTSCAYLFYKAIFGAAILT